MHVPTTKGRKQIQWLKKSFPEIRFEPLNCEPTAVPDRMRSGAAFVHLSRYEGNSIVCNEAMAMNLPCLFTRVGLMNDADGPHADVFVIDRDRAFASRDYLRSRFAAFLSSLQTRQYRPREWVKRHANQAKYIDTWRQIVEDFKASYS